MAIPQYELNPLYDKAFKELHHLEGGYSNLKNDRGGATRFGITEAVARANGYMGPMDQMPFEWFVAIGKTQYWDQMKLDTIASLSYHVAYELFDTGFNAGIGRAGEFFQRSLNAANRQGKDYPDVKVDNIIGNASIYCFKQYLKVRKERDLLVMLNCLQGAFYIRLAESDPSQEGFVNGWIANRVAKGLFDYAAIMALKS